MKEEEREERIVDKDFADLLRAFKIAILLSGIAVVVNILFWVIGR